MGFKPRPKPAKWESAGSDETLTAMTQTLALCHILDAALTAYDLHTFGDDVARDIMTIAHRANPKSFKHIVYFTDRYQPLAIRFGLYEKL